ncbi:peptidase M48, Ste24p [Acidisarcina polymorpha]|uniref:Peptidase M48, Ste24p n=1 Tax=Acidisarcina polymorpha TaxID=2211140 RepID=A0A2Z5G5Z7_9BACT|nr:M48 family metallopeptidase [Acidisarcina polymorpha]AXC14518.1 peptidase M48, Ste24p [Acidisarcina polymorpha]
MHLRFLLFLFTFTLFAAITVNAATTPTEAAAIAAAERDHSAYVLPPDKLAQSDALARVRVALTFGTPLLGMLALFLTLQWHIAARMRNVAMNLSNRAGFSKNRWVQCFLFFFEFLLFMTVLSLPLNVYEHHVQSAYGLSVQGWGSWLADQAKSFGLNYLFGGLGVMLLFYLIRRFPRRWWLWLWIPTMAFSLLAVFAEPYVIAPLFNKFEPLSHSDPELVTQLERVVARGKGIDIPPERMFLMKASDKVTTLNAYVSGFGASKRIVVWDTSLAKASPDEILFIFGHEMGHYVLGHILRGMLFAFIFILVSFFLGFHLFQFLLARFGPRWHIRTQDDWAALVVFVLVLSLIDFLGEPVQSAFSRSLEHAADIYGQEVVHGIVADPQRVGRAAFQLLGENGLATPNPSAFVTFWTADHPPLWWRASFAKHYDPWTANAQSKYFPNQ